MNGRKSRENRISRTRARCLEEMTCALERRRAPPAIPQEPKQISTCVRKNSPLAVSLKRDVEIPERTLQTQSCRIELPFIRETFQPTKSVVRGSVAIGGKHTKKQ